MIFDLIHGDALIELKKIDSNSVDSLLTDPPAGISFMNKKWDHHKGGRNEWIKWLTEIMAECYRVVKPGAHGFVWAIPRTSHWTATALEDAGFEIRDVVTHLFGSGFPKSMDISKAIDKQAGAEREVVGISKNDRPKSQVKGGKAFDRSHDKGQSHETIYDTKPNSPEAKQWDGWGTALKPASEHWILIRKPCSEKTVAKNVLKWGVGGLNIDGCRISTEDKMQSGRHLQKNRKYPSGYKDTNRTEYKQNNQGRFPANLILDDEAGALLDAQSGPCKTGKLEPHHTLRASKNNSMSGPNQARNPRQSFGGDTGGASRFFYCAKPSKRERNAGLQGDTVNVNDGRATSIDNPFQRGETQRLNTHPTVKPIKLLTYLARLTTPTGGTVIDPFMGSGSTGCAAIKEGFNFIGIERESEYVSISRARIATVREL